MSQNDLRNMLICVLKNGLVAKTIAEKTSIPPDILSRFKMVKYVYVRLMQISLRNICH